MDLCRLCHLETRQDCCKNLFINGNHNPQILEIIETLTGLKINEEDPFPKTACSDCYEKLISFYDFRKLILQADEKFHQEWYNTSLINDAHTEIDDPLIKPEHMECDDDINDDNSESQESDAKSSEDLDSKTLVEDGKQNSKFADDEKIENTDTEETEDLIKPPNLKIENEQPSNSHKNRSNNSTKQYHCDLCSKSYSKSTYLKVHRRIHTGERPFRCSTCNKGFICPQNYKRHLRKHSNETKTYLCDICGKNFKQKGWFERHKHVEPQNDEKFICEVCSKIFTTRQKLLAHLLIHQDRKKEFHPCPICNKLVSSRTNLKKHLRIHAGERPYSCDVCNAKFSEKSSLIAHSRIHNDEKPFSCHICTKSFRVKSALTVHIRSHTNEKPYICNICFNSYRVKAHLNEHMISHSTRRPYVCEICNTTFRRRGGLYRHRKKKHKEKNEERVEEDKLSNKNGEVVE